MREVGRQEEEEEFFYFRTEKKTLQSTIIQNTYIITLNKQNKLIVSL